MECSYLGTTKLAVPPFVKYQWVHDGSITAGGREMMLQPLFGDNFVQGISALAGEFERYGFQADNSCGLHVHVGVPDWGAQELRKLILLYHKYENLFYQLVAPGRDGWRDQRGERKYYAKRWDWKAPWYAELSRKSTGQEIRRWIVESLYKEALQHHEGPNYETQRVKVKSVFNGGHSYCLWPQKPEVTPHGYRNMPNISGHKYEACRYYGLNLHTFFQRNTVEFRHHEGTVAVDKLLYWPLWCGWFVELASQLTLTEIENLSTVPQLVYGEWSRWAGKPLTIPVYVRDWVVRTLKERGHAETIQ